MGLIAALQAIGEAISTTPTRGTALWRPRCGPTLSVSWCPAVKDRAEAAEAAAEPDARFWAFARAEPVEPAEPLGSAVARNPKRCSTRNGERGITQYGRRRVREGCALLEEHRACLAFWTVTLPTEALLHLNETDRWPMFQDRIRKELARRLQLAGLVPEIVGVVEIQEKRTRRTGVCGTHLHICYRAKRTRWNCWAIDPASLDWIILAALQTCGMDRCDVSTAGKVQPIRKSVGRYMAKYMTKGSCLAAVCPRQKNLVPRQWWFMTAPLASRVAAATLEMPWDFCSWLGSSREALEEAGLLTYGRYRIPDPLAPAVYWFQWPDPGGLARTVAMWQEAIWDAEWFASNRPIHAGFHHCQHPKQHQYL